MNNYLTGTTGNTYILSTQIGSGGEGSVYNVNGDSSIVIKIFKPEKATETRHRKLLIMHSTSLPHSALSQVAWPLDIVYQSGKFVGYVMPRVQYAEPLNVIYSDKYNCSLQEKINIAMNLCVAISSVHNAGQVCGDLNPNNICVNPPTGLITLVDTDSYHITDPSSSVIYRCECGLPEYLPAEVQTKMKNGKSLVTAPLPTYSKYTDLFALAVHIFGLLMNGCHPFACAIDQSINIQHLSVNQPSITVPQPVDNICDGYFNFAQSKPRYATPIYAPEYSYLPEEIRKLFNLTFIEGHAKPEKRVDAETWYFALDRMKNSLVICKSNSAHMYTRENKICPWCALKNKMQQNAAKMYAERMKSVPQQTTSSASAHLSQSYQQTAKPTLNTPANTPATTVSAPSYTSSRKKQKRKTGRIVVFALLIIALVATLFRIVPNLDIDLWPKENESGSGYVDNNENEPQFVSNSGEFRYTVNSEGEATIIECLSIVDSGNEYGNDYPTLLAGDVVVPETIDGYTVTAIGEEVFAHCIINSIELPDTITRIGYGAFKESILEGKRFKFPDNLTVIEGYAFYAFSFDWAHETNIELPHTLQRIGAQAFSGSNLMHNKIHIPAGVTEIGNNAFSWSHFSGFSVDENNNFYSSKNGELYSCGIKVMDSEGNSVLSFSEELLHKNSDMYPPITYSDASDDYPGYTWSIREDTQGIIGSISYDFDNNGYVEVIAFILDENGRIHVVLCNNDEQYGLLIQDELSEHFEFLISGDVSIDIGLTNGKIVMHRYYQSVPGYSLFSDTVNILSVKEGIELVCEKSYVLERNIMGLQIYERTSGTYYYVEAESSATLEDDSVFITKRMFNEFMNAGLEGVVDIRYYEELPYYHRFDVMIPEKSIYIYCSFNEDPFLSCYMFNDTFYPYPSYD